MIHFLIIKSNNSAQHIDDEKLIEEVERNTFIYETKHHDYRNLPLRLHIWNQIADALHVSDRKMKKKSCRGSCDPAEAENLMLIRLFFNHFKWGGYQPENFRKL